jgi:hypothetical protein
MEPEFLESAHAADVLRTLLSILSPASAATTAVGNANASTRVHDLRPDVPRANLATVSIYNRRTGPSSDQPARRQKVSACTGASAGFCGICERRFATVQVCAANGVAERSEAGINRMSL